MVPIGNESNSQNLSSDISVPLSLQPVNMMSEIKTKLILEYIFIIYKGHNV